MAEPQSDLQSLPLDGHVALVTGAGKRIGREIALTLAKAGADIFVHYGRSAASAESTAEEIRSLGRKAWTVPGDLSEPDETAQRIFETVANIGLAPSILVNSAAIFENDTLEDLSPELFDRQFAINLQAPMYLCQQFNRHRPADFCGSIVNIIDWRSERPTGKHLSYTISKAGLLALTRGLAIELGPDVRVNAVAPGPILPPPGGDESHFDSIIPVVPLKAHGSAQDIADAVLYLTTARFVTGEMIRVTGGQQLQTPPLSQN